MKSQYLFLVPGRGRKKEGKRERKKERGEKRKEERKLPTIFSHPFSLLSLILSLSFSLPNSASEPLRRWKMIPDELFSSSLHLMNFLSVPFLVLSPLFSSLSLSCSLLPHTLPCLLYTFSLTHFPLGPQNLLKH